MRVSGLVSRPELDGVVCDALKFDAKTGQDAVALGGGLCWKQGPYVWDSPSNPADWPELSVPSPLGGLPVLSFLSERSLPNRTLRTALGWLSHEE